MSYMAITYQLEYIPNDDGVSDVIYEDIYETVFKPNGFDELVKGMYIIKSDNPLVSIFKTLDELKQCANAKTIKNIYAFEIRGEVNNMLPIISSTQPVES